MANEPLILASQVLNHNIENPDAAVRHKIEIEWVRDAELDTPLRPLYASPAQVLVALGGDTVPYGIENPDPIHEAASCSPGQGAPNSKQTSVWTDPLGRRFASHWVVPPGREVRHTLITWQLNLSFDTTIHAIGVHVHPFLESLAFRDLSTDETLWTARTRPPAEGIGLAEIDFYASTEGIPVYQDHEYEMVSVYDNTSGVDQDAMAVMFFYLYDIDTERRLPYLRRLADWAAEAH